MTHTITESSTFSGMYFCHYVGKYSNVFSVLALLKALKELTHLVFKLALMLIVTRGTNFIDTKIVFQPTTCEIIFRELRCPFFVGVF